MFVVAAALPAQQAAPPAGLTLGQAVEDALRNYPSIRVSQEQINAAAAGIQLARTAYLPRVDMLAQANRATRNNVFGMLLPQGIIPSISGPVLGTNNLGTAWGCRGRCTGYVGALRFRSAEDERGCRYRGAKPAGGCSQADSIRCYGGGRGRVRNFGRGAGDGPCGAGRRRSCGGACPNHQLRS